MPSAPRHLFRLQGHHEGQGLLFDLAPGEIFVGSAQGNGVRLPFAGVSRRHASIQASAEGLVVEDLGSKNGTFVDGSKVLRAAAGGGTRLAFGPVRLEVEAIEEDAALAIRFEAHAGEISSLSSREHSETRLVEAPETSEEDALTLLDELTLELESRDTDALLHRVIDHLGADGLCLVEWNVAGEPLALESAGELAEVPALELLEQLPAQTHRDGAWHCGRFEHGLVAARLPRPIEDETSETPEASDTDAGRVPTALLLWQRQGDVALSPRLLRLLTRLLLVARRHRRPGAGPSRERFEEVELRFPAGYLVGTSPAMKRFYEQMAAVSRLRTPVLLHGETGVGKELLARTLHDSSSPLAPYEVVNCAAIPSNLLEAEMFGVVRGAATGVEARPGHFARADGGTLFLDEIGELAPELQAKLLRTLQEREIQPVGGEPRPVDVRVIAATNVDLDSGALRRDLYYRLAAGLLEVPPLRQAREDIPRLVQHYLQLAAVEMGCSLRGVTARALESLCAYAWPGNIRELSFVMRRIAAHGPRGGIVDIDSLPAAIRRPIATELDEMPADLELKPHLEALERRLIREAMVRAGGRQVDAAQLLGVSRSGLAKMLDRLDLRDSWARTPEPGEDG